MLPIIVHLFSHPMMPCVGTVDLLEALVLRCVSALILSCYCAEVVFLPALIDGPMSISSLKSTEPSQTLTIAAMQCVSP